MRDGGNERRGRRDRRGDKGDRQHARVGCAAACLSPFPSAGSLPRFSYLSCKAAKKHTQRAKTTPKRTEGKGSGRETTETSQGGEKRRERKDPNGRGGEQAGTGGRRTGKEKPKRRKTQRQVTYQMAERRQQKANSRAPTTTTSTTPRAGKKQARKETNEHERRENREPPGDKTIRFCYLCFFFRFASLASPLFPPLVWVSAYGRGRPETKSQPKGAGCCSTCRFPFLCFNHSRLGGFVCRCCWGIHFKSYSAPSSFALETSKNSSTLCFAIGS